MCHLAFCRSNLLRAVACIAILTLHLRIAGAEEQAPAKSPSIACQGAPDFEASAMDAARELLEQQWLVTEKGYFAAYVEPAEKRNPFDLAPPDPHAGARLGFVQARPPTCVSEREASGSIKVRFTTPFYRFREKGQRWSPPLRNGLMLEVMLVAKDGSWSATEAKSEKAILDVDVKPRRPSLQELPQLSAWLAPVPGCGRHERWDGNACVPRKR